MKNQIIKNVLFVLLLVILLVPAIFPFVKPGFIVTDDGGWMIIRLSAFFDTIRDGQIPARFIERLNFGYGYPVANFLYPGYLYIGSIIHITGFNFTESVKILFSLSIIFSGIFSFIWLRRLFTNVDAFIGAVVYVYSPYHLFDIFKRGSLGEALSISVLPLALYGIERASTILIALSIFLLLIFHNTLAVLFLPLIPIYALLRKSFLRSIPGIILGVLLSSFFTIPALFELQYTKFFITKVSNPLEYFAGLNLIGIVSVVIFASAIILFGVIYKGAYKKSPYFNLVIMFALLFLLSVFLSSEVSSSIWKIISSSFIQFPYRILSLMIISVSFLAAYLSYILFKKVKIVAVVIMLGLVSFSSYSYLSDVTYTDLPDEYYSTNESTTTIHDEYMPKWVKQKPSARPQSKVEVLSGDAQILNIRENSSKIQFETKVSTPSVVRINTIYWPGWEVYVDNEKREISYDNELGVIEINIKQYDDNVYVLFKEDFVRTISNTLTILAGIALVYYISRPLIKF